MISRYQWSGLLYHDGLGLPVAVDPSPKNPEKLGIYCSGVRSDCLSVGLELTGWFGLLVVRLAGLSLFVGFVGLPLPLSLTLSTDH